jgi:hypothetical protein
LLNRKHTRSKSTAKGFVFLNHKYTGSKSTANKHAESKSAAKRFILLNSKKEVIRLQNIHMLNLKHAGSKSTADLIENDKKFRSSKHCRASNATKFAIAGGL